MINVTKSKFVLYVFWYYPTITGFCVIMAILLSGIVRSSALADDPSRQRRFIYNSDAGNMFVAKRPPMKPEDLHSDIDAVANAGVTTFFISPNVGMVMNFPSKHARMLGDEEEPSIRNRIKDEASKKPGTTRAAVNLKTLVDMGHDPLQIIIERAKKMGMEVFISFRVNEVHGADNPEGFSQQLIISRFWREHPDWRVGKQGDELSNLHTEILGPRTNPIVGKWLAGGLNFAIPEVRQRRLDQLRECLERYDIDGLELDFQRFPVFFKYGEEGKYLPTMTNWMREVRDMSLEVAEKSGRPLLLSARIMARPEQNVGIGLDPITWAQEGLVDFLVVSHYLHNNFPLPVREYRGLLPDDLPLYASIEVEREVANYKKIAEQLYLDGVDGILMFNFFTSRDQGNEPQYELLKELGDPDSISHAEQ